MGGVIGLCLYSRFVLHLIISKFGVTLFDFNWLNSGFGFLLDQKHPKKTYLRQSVAGGDLARFQSVGLGLGDGGAGNAPEGPKVPLEKPKKVVPLSKQLTNKISSGSSKLTELMAWEAKVADNKTLYLILIYK